jgi:hypothetical protein
MSSPKGPWSSPLFLDAYSAFPRHPILSRIGCGNLCMTAILKAEGRNARDHCFPCVPSVFNPDLSGPVSTCRSQRPPYPFHIRRISKARSSLLVQEDIIGPSAIVLSDFVKY